MANKGFEKLWEDIAEYPKSDLEAIVNLKRKFDTDGSLTIVVGKLPKNILQEFDILHIGFDEGIDEYVSVFENNPNRRKGQR